MISSFVDRQQELLLLENEWNKAGASLIILYGRRRIGKTRLLTEFASGKKGIFYLAGDVASRIQINDLKGKIADFLKDDLLAELEIGNWDQLFDYLGRNCGNERFCLLIDEFSYLIKNDRSVLSALQKHWDTQLSSSGICIILSGSMLGLMSKMVLSHASPLYGRRSRDLLLEGLLFRDAQKLLSMPVRDRMETYMAVGGVPEYLLKASGYPDITGFVENEFFSRYGYFYREPYFVLSQEFRETKTYFSILNAIAEGNTKPTQIANYIGFETRKIYPYLDNLIRLGFIERKVSIAGSPKKGIYLIKDSVFDFWFNSVYPRREGIEKGNFTASGVDMSRYFGRRFETLVEKELVYYVLPKTFSAGKWWFREEEIDVVAVNEGKREICFFECKWRDVNEKTARKLLFDLKQKTPLVKWHNEKRKESYGLFGKHITGKAALRKDGYLVFDQEDLEEAALADDMPIGV
jgi:AAA+ ATPase superfamily predicted ATPase